MRLSPGAQEVLGRSLAASLLATIAGSEVAAVLNAVTWNEGSLGNFLGMLLLSALVAPIYAGMFVVPLGTAGAAASWPLIRHLDGQKTVTTLMVLSAYGVLLGCTVGAVAFGLISLGLDVQSRAQDFAMIAAWGAFFGGVSAAAWWLLIPGDGRAK